MWFETYKYEQGQGSYPEVNSDDVYFKKEDCWRVIKRVDVYNKYNDTYLGEVDLETFYKVTGKEAKNEEKAVTDLYHDLEKQNELLRKYITRGGFIQDCHGKWCKEGDKVRYKRPDPFGKPNTFIERTAILEYTEGQHFKLVDEIALFSDYIELIEPCEPDICKDFEGEEL